MVLDLVSDPCVVILTIIAIIAICFIYFAKRFPKRFPGDAAGYLLLNAGMARLKSGGAIVYPVGHLGSGHFLPESDLDPYLDWSSKMAKRGLKLLGWGLVPLIIVCAFLDLHLVDSVVLMLVWGELLVLEQRRFKNKDFSFRFPASQEVKDPQKWRRWGLAFLTIMDRPLWLSIGIVVCFFALPLFAIDLNHLRIPPIWGWFDWVEHLVLVGSFWLFAVVHGFLVVQDLRFRRDHGRRPTHQDVEALG